MERIDRLDATEQQLVDLFRQAKEGTDSTQKLATTHLSAQLNDIYNALNDVLMHGGLKDEAHQDILNIRDSVYGLLR